MQKKDDNASMLSVFFRKMIRYYEYIYKQHFLNTCVYGMTLISDEELVKKYTHDVFIHICKNGQTLGKIDNIRLYHISSPRKCIPNFSCNFTLVK